MSGDDLTVSILREIRDEIRATRTDLGERIDETNKRLDERLGETNERLAETNNRLGVVETTLQEFAGQHLLLTRYVKHSVDRHGEAIDDLRDRVGKLEAAGAGAK
jgi:chromosome segregation ATPase